MSLIPQFTPVEWAIVAGSAFSALTLGLVSLDLYLSHLKTKQSDISIHESKSRDVTLSNRQKSRFRVPCNFVNDGQRSAVVRARSADLEFRPSNETVPWGDMQNFDPRAPLASIDHLDNHTVGAGETAQSTLKFSTRGAEPLEERIDAQDEVGVTFTVDVEDNVRHYQITLTATVDLSD